MFTSSNVRRLIQKRIRQVSKSFSKTSKRYKINEIGEAIQFLSIFPEDSVSASMAACNTCNFLASSDHLILGIPLQKYLRNKFFTELHLENKRNLPIQYRYQIRPKLYDEWRWVRNQMKFHILQWVASGVSTNDLLGLVCRAKLEGALINSEIYSAVLKISLCLEGSRQHLEEGRGGTLSHPLKSLLGIMMKELGLETTEKQLLASSYQVCMSIEQLKLVNQYLQDLTEKHSEVCQGDKLAASLISVDNPKTVMDFFTQYVLTCSAPLPAHVYEGLIHTCARHHQLYFALNLINCMTLRHGRAPSVNSYRLLIVVMNLRLLQKRGKGKPYGKVTTEMCYSILTALCHVYDGKPPLWVYAEMARNLALLEGIAGYQMLLKKCEERMAVCATKTQSPEEKQAILKTVWRVSIYVHIIKGCVVTGDCDLALHMLSEMQRMKHCVRMCNYEALIQIVNKPDHLNHFLPTLLMMMTKDLRKNEMDDMQLCLKKALARVHKASPRTASRQQASRGIHFFMDAAAEEMVKTIKSSHLGHRNCIHQLKMLSRPNIGVATENSTSDTPIALAVAY